MVLFAVIAGVGTGLIMMVPQLEETSIHNIGVYEDAWVLFAMIICSNCEKPLEATLKTFVFFLVSQPLVYLTMWPVYQEFPWHYYRYWFMWTCVTPFFAVIAWRRLRKDAACQLIRFVKRMFAVWRGATERLHIMSK